MGARSQAGIKSPLTLQRPAALRDSVARSVSTYSPSFRERFPCPPAPISWRNVESLMQSSLLASYLANHTDAIRRFRSDPTVHADARAILERFLVPKGRLPRVELWANLDPSERHELAPLGSYCLEVLESCICDYRISPDERFVLQQLRKLLRLDDGLLLHQHSEEVESFVVRAMADILADDQVDAREHSCRALRL